MWRAVVSQPLDRSHESLQLGPLDDEAGEFWVSNPFQMPQLGHNLSAFERNRLFLNVDGEGFMDASFASRANIDSDSRTVIAADFNVDGATDLLVGSVGGGPLRLFLNRFPKHHHWVRIALQGVASNRAGIGSQLVIHCGDRKLTRSLFPANGFMGQSPAEMLVGVGEATRIEQLVIRWSTGQIQVFEDLPVDGELRFTEGNPSYDVIGP